MTPTPAEIRSIYAGIEKLPFKIDLQGWNSDGPIFQDVILRTKPKVIVEVGSWKGASAVHMAMLTKTLGFDTVIYAVDIWNPTAIGVGLGEYPKTHIPPRFDEPGMYEQFLFNVKASGCDDRIIPVRGLTRCIAGLLQHWGVSAQALYVDASHDEESVYGDLVAFWPIVSAGGIMCGDDYGGHEGVRRAVDRFAREDGRTVQVYPAKECTQWAFDPK